MASLRLCGCIVIALGKSRVLRRVLLPYHVAERWTWVRRSLWSRSASSRRHCRRHTTRPWCLASCSSRRYRAEIVYVEPAYGCIRQGFVINGGCPTSAT